MRNLTLTKTAVKPNVKQSLGLKGEISNVSLMFFNYRPPLHVHKAVSGVLWCHSCFDWLTGIRKTLIGCLVWRSILVGCRIFIVFPPPPPPPPPPHFYLFSLHHHHRHISIVFPPPPPLPPPHFYCFPSKFGLLSLLGLILASLAFEGKP